MTELTEDDRVDRAAKAGYYDPDYRPGNTPKYRTIVVDPPWGYSEGFVTQSRSPGRWSGDVTTKPLPYPSMTVGEIEALPVRDLAFRDCRLFLWTTNRYLPFAFKIVGVWGFIYKQTLTWKKTDALNGSIAPNSEFLIVATRGTPNLLTRLNRELFARRQRLGWDTWGNEALEHVELTA
jgi:N6-adenosine-specific RNA methylase IME4